MALNFPSTPPDGTVWTDPNGEQWVYNAAENSWTSKGLINHEGGLTYKGGLNITQAPPTAQSGDFWSVETGGTANAGFGPGVTGDVATGSLILYDGAQWELINVDPTWNRIAGKIEPVNATDVIHGESGITAGPNDEIDLNPDGSGVFAAGQAVINNAGVLDIQSTTAAADASTLLRCGSANVTGGANAFVVKANGSATFAGNVGIGENSGSYRLQVKETGGNTIVGALESSQSYGYLVLNSSETTSNAVRVGSNGDDFVVNTGSVEHLRLESNGDLKLGGTLPSAPNITLDADGNVTIGAPDFGSASNGILITKTDSVGAAGVLVFNQTTDVNFASCFAVYGAGSNNRVADIRNDGSASFANTVTFGGSVGTTDAAYITNDGDVVSDRFDPDSRTFYSLNNGVTKAYITAGGSASFAGSSTFGTTGGTEARIGPSDANNARVVVNNQQSTPDTVALGVYGRDDSEYKARIDADGSATFAGNVEAGSYKNVANPDTNGIRLADSGFIGISRTTTGYVFLVRTEMEGEVIGFQADGSASFAGNVTAPNISGFKSKLLAAATGATTVEDLKTAIINALADL